MQPIWNSLLLLTLLTSVALPAAENPVGTGPSFKGPVGLQLYSLRGEFIKNVPSTLNKVRDYGFRIVETAGTYNLTPEKFRSLLDTNKLRAVAGHFPYDAYRTNLDGIIREAKVLGLWYVGCAWIPHEGEFDEKECRDAIALFNQAGAELAKHNLKFYYHAHGYEFRPHGNGTLLDLMMAETKPEHVFYEMDVYWVVHPGKDPVQLLEKYGKRWLMLHLKDMRKGVKGDLTGKGNVNDNVPLGTGQMNWPAILQAAKKAGVKFYFIEDESAAVADQIPQSLRYLEQVKW